MTNFLKEICPPAVALLLLTAPAGAACRQALSLALDISGSVDADEYRLQIDGLAGALVDPAVIDAFLAMPTAPVRLHIFEWAGFDTQRDLSDWTEITDVADLEIIAHGLRTHVRKPREVATALGRAMEYGAAALAGQRDCWKRTLDISGDGESNIGIRPREVKAAGTMAGLTVNGLVIGASSTPGSDRWQIEITELEAYYTAEVIHGPDAFVETAVGFEAYQEAITRKLLRELAVIAIGRVGD